MRFLTMSSSGFLLSLDIDRQNCRRVPVLIFFGTCLALAAVNLSDLALQSRALAVVLVLACASWEVRAAWPGCPAFVSRILVTTDGRFFLGIVRSAPSLVPATVAHWWVLPRLATGLVFVGPDGQRWLAVVFRDRLAPDDWRRLQVRLRHGSG